MLDSNEEEQGIPQCLSIYRLINQLTILLTILLRLLFNYLFISDLIPGRGEETRSGESKFFE